MYSVETGLFIYSFCPRIAVEKKQMVPGEAANKPESKHSCVLRMPSLDWGKVPIKLQCKEIPFLCLINKLMFVEVTILILMLPFQLNKLLLPYINSFFCFTPERQMSNLVNSGDRTLIKI